MQQTTGLLVSITAMLTAFAVLAGIALVVYLLRLFSVPRGVAPELRRPVAAAPASLAGAGPVSGVQPVLPEAGDHGVPPQVVAAITAVLSTYLDRPVAFAPRIAPSASGSWVALGRQVQLRSRRVGKR